MTFEDVEYNIRLLNLIDTKSHSKEYSSLFWKIHDILLEMEKSGEIILEPGAKSIGYLRTLLENDGLEYSYTIIFWHKDSTQKKYRIGVCVRGLPMLKKVDGNRL